jgi:hypothetical protein
MRIPNNAKLDPVTLYRGRLLYNLQSAVTLHFLLSHFTPLASPVVMILPIPNTWHVALSAGCLGFAMFAFVATPSTWGLLGKAAVWFAACRSML